MDDIFEKSKRSEIMRKVRSSGNTSTELRLISLFRSKNITGWRRNYHVIGHPDFVFLSQHVAIFVDGCFWHGHECRNIHPNENHEYWERKINRNIQHDQEINKRFTLRGWTVLRIWECELKKARLDETFEKISFALGFSRAQ